MKLRTTRPLPLNLLVWLPLAGLLMSTFLWQDSQARANLAPLPENELVTGFTTRFAGQNVYETAVTLAQATFPATSHANQPGAIILARADNKPELMAAVSLIHHPIDAPILFVDQDRLPPETSIALARFHPEGITFDRKVQVLVVGSISESVVQEVEALGLRVRHIQGDTDDPASLAAAVDDYRASLHADHPDVVVVASLDEPDFALPALSFAAHMPTGFAFVTRDGIPEATRGLLSRRFGPTFMYLMGPESAISASVARELAQYGHVQRLSAPDPYALSAYFAGYRDSGQDFGYWIGRKARDFGWGIAEPGHNFTFVNPDDWATGLAATVLSHRGKHGPILLVQPDSVPDPVRRYLDQVVRPYQAAPYDQLFNHGSIVGGTDAISLRVQGELDALLAPASAGPRD